MAMTKKAKTDQCTFVTWAPDKVVKWPHMWRCTEPAVEGVPACQVHALTYEEWK